MYADDDLEIQRENEIYSKWQKEDEVKNEMKQEKAFNLESMLNEEENDIVSELPMKQLVAAPTQRLSVKSSNSTLSGVSFATANGYDEFTQLPSQGIEAG